VSNSLTAPVIVGLAIGIFTALSLAPNSVASTEPQTIDVQLGNKTFQLSYNMSNGGSIDSVKAESNQPYGGHMILEITSPAKGFLEVSIPRELFDLVGFTDHFEEGLAILVDQADLSTGENTSFSCDKVVVRVPIEAQSEEVILTVGDILGLHGHHYPPALHATKEITVDESKFNVHMWTDGIKCDVSFSKEQKKLQVDIEGRNKTSGGGFSIVIPPELLGGNYTVLVDGKKVNYTEQAPYIEYIGNSSDNFILHKLGFKYPAGAKTIDVIGTSVLDPKSAFKAFSLSHDVHGLTYFIDGKTQTGINIVNSTILPNLGIYIDLNTTTGGIMEFTLPKRVIEDVRLVEVSHSDVQEAVNFEIIREDEDSTVIRFAVIDGAWQASIKGAGGIVPEFGSIAALIMVISLVAVISWNFVRKRFGFV
jgi:hypothetical protein